MSSEVFQLALLLTLKDAASSALDRFEARLRAAGKSGEAFEAEFSKIRSEIGKDLKIGAIGLGGLGLLKKGVDIAADYQSVMTDLRATIATTGKDGAVDLNKLSQEMVGAEALAVRLGNALPGTTADFALELQALKQNGLDLQTILGGAGEAFAHLAVANNSIPKDVAAYGAEFGNLFKLKPNEFVPAADTMSRIFTSHGQTAEELIEAAKYFQGRAGATLGISGLKSAEEFTQLFGLMGMKGIRGSMGGTMLTDFFDEFVKKKKQVAELQKATGIKLDFFDKQGKFAGLDTVFEQMKQFDKLSDKDRSAWMTKVFGIRGTTAANVFSGEGLEGWKKFKEQQEQVIDMESKVAMKTATYNNQMEALQGTLTNLKVSIFEPMLPGLTSVLTKSNDLVGSLQTLAKEHPQVAKYAIEFLGIGAAVMTVYSGVGLLTNGIKIFRLMSSFSKTEGILGYLTRTDVALQKTGQSVGFFTERASGNIAGFTGKVQTAEQRIVSLGNTVDGTAGKVGVLRKDLFSLNNVFKAVLVLEAVGFTWDQISQLRKTIDDSKAMQSGLNMAGKQTFTAYQQTPQEQRNPKAQARDMFTLLQGGNNELTVALDRSKQTWTDWYARSIGRLVGKDTSFQLFQGRETPEQMLKDPQANARVQEIKRQPFKQQSVDNLFPDPYIRVMSERAAVKNLRDRAPSLADPAVMSSFRKDVIPSMGLSDVKQQFLNQLLQQAFPESFAASLSGITEQGKTLAQTLSSLNQPVSDTSGFFLQLSPAMQPVPQQFTDLGMPLSDTKTSLLDLYNAARPVPPPLFGLRDSAYGAGGALDQLTAKITSFNMPTPSVTTDDQGNQHVTYSVPGRAVGGVVERHGFAYVHAGNVITPARITHGLQGFDQLMNLARRPQEMPVVNLLTQGGGSHSFEETATMVRSLVTSRSEISSLRQASSEIVRFRDFTSKIEKYASMREPSVYSHNANSIHHLGFPYSPGGDARPNAGRLETAGLGSLHRQIPVNPSSVSTPLSAGNYTSAGRTQPLVINSKIQAGIAAGRDGNTEKSIEELLAGIRLPGADRAAAAVHITIQSGDVTVNAPAGKSVDEKMIAEIRQAAMMSDKQLEIKLKKIVTRMAKLV